jgi:hypothetical protein
MALLAYEEPDKSPLFNYLSMDYRHSVADELNCAILGMRPISFVKCSCYNFCGCQFSLLFSIFCTTMFYLLVQRMPFS